MSNENKTFKLDKYWLEEKGEINFKCCDFEEQDSLRSERWSVSLYCIYVSVCVPKSWNSWCLALSFLSNSGFHPEQKEIWPTAAPSINAHSIIFNGFFHLHKKGMVCFSTAQIAHTKYNSVQCWSQMTPTRKKQSKASLTSWQSCRIPTSDRGQRTQNEIIRLLHF